jgi:polyhydroxyalkanoate synthesis regulator phasin
MRLEWFPNSQDNYQEGSDAMNDLTKRIAEIAKDWNARWLIEPMTIENALVNALTEFSAELTADRERIADLEAQNHTFRNAQKACEDCDGPTMAEVKQLRERIAELETGLSLIGRALEDHDKLISELLVLQAQVAKMREALTNWNRVWRETEAEDDDCNFAAQRADEALSSSPDPPLRDRVVEVISEFLNNSYPTNYEGGAWYQKARTLLRDLGATNHEQPTD